MPELTSDGVAPCAEFPLGLYAHEVAALPLEQLRALLATAADRRRFVGSTNHLVPRGDDGALDGTVVLRPWGIGIQNGRFHGLFWSEALTLSLPLLRRLLAVARDERRS